MGGQQNTLDALPPGKRQEAGWASGPVGLSLFSELRRLATKILKYVAEVMCKGGTHRKLLLSIIQTLQDGV